MHTNHTLREHQREMERAALLRSTILKRMSILTRCEHAIGKPLTEATTEDLRDWLDDHQLVARTRYNYISHLAAFYRWAILDGHCAADPTLRLTRPKLRRSLPRPVASDDVVFAVENAPDAAMESMLLLAAESGLRVGEIAAVDVEDIFRAEDDYLLLVHGKGDKERIVPLTDSALSAMRRHGLPGHGAVFKFKGERIKPVRVSMIVRDHLHACGIHASAHQLRHRFATDFYRESGRDLRLTQEILGHESPTSTAIYTAVDKARAAAVMKRLSARRAA